LTSVRKKEEKKKDSGNRSLHSYYSKTGRCGGQVRRGKDGVMKVEKCALKRTRKDGAMERELKTDSAQLNDTVNKILGTCIIKTVTSRVNSGKGWRGALLYVSRRRKEHHLEKRGTRIIAPIEGKVLKIKRKKRQHNNWRKGEKYTPRNQLQSTKPALKLDRESD